MQSLRLRRYSNFVDEWSMHLHAGTGGKGGCAFFRSTINPRGKPCGGNGGRGGHVWIQVDPSMDNLMGLEKQYRAESGGSGSRNRQEGANGKDCLIRVPLGTEIKCEGVLLSEGNDVAPLLLCRGGKGGRGNYAMGLNNHEYEAGEPGEEKRVSLNLMTIADVGLVGMPNAGKSSLLAALTRANPKIAAYPFTTLVPRKGVLEIDNRQLSICDIPGLIEGAHRNIGLGHSFLKHIVKSRLIAYVVDVARPEPWLDIAILDHELEQYRRGLLQKRILIIANKADLLENDDKVRHLQHRLGDQVRIVPISAKHGQGLEHLRYQLKTLL